MRTKNTTLRIYFSSIYLFIFSLSLQAQILQPGDLVMTCLPGDDDVTLVIKDMSQLGMTWMNPANHQQDWATIVDTKKAFTTTDFDGNWIMSVEVDYLTGDIYAATTSLYSPTPSTPSAIGKTPVDPIIYKVDADNCLITKVSTLPGQLGIGAIALDPNKDVVYATNTDDGKLYSVNRTTGAIIDTYDFGAPDSGSGFDFPDIGDRTLAVDFNELESRLYYSVWTDNQFANSSVTGVPNQVWSIEVDGSCSFVPSSNQLELSSYPGSLGYTQPIGDLEFNDTFDKLLLAESGFTTSGLNGDIIPHAHGSIVLGYEQTGGSWTALPAYPGNLQGAYDIGDQPTYRGANARGGVDWAPKGYDGCGYSGSEDFVVATGDYLLDVTTYGFQFFPASGGGPQNGLIVDGDGLEDQAKYVFADIDIYTPDPRIDLELDKSVDVTNAEIGDNITYTIEVFNNSCIPVENIQVRDLLPAGANYVSHAGSSYNSQTGIWSAGTIGAGQTSSIEITAEVTAGGSLYNVAEIIGHDGNDDIDSDPDNGDPYEDDIDAVCVSVPLPLPCDGSGIVIEAAAGFSSYQWYKDGVALSGETSLNLAVSEVGSYTYDLVDSGCAFGSCCSIEIIEGDCFVPNFDLALTKKISSQGPYAPGSAIQFEIKVVNEGNLDAVDTEVTDSAPPYLLYQGMVANANVVDNGDGTFTIANIPIGGSETFYIDYLISPTYQGESGGNDAEITDDSGDDVDSDPETGDDVDEDGDGNGDDDDEDGTDFPINQVYDLSLIKTITSDGPYAPGDLIEFTIAVSNDGTLDAMNVEVTDSSPSFLLYQSFQQDPNLIYNGNGVWEILSIPAGQTESIVVTYQIDPVAQALTGTNIAQITGDDGEDVDSTPDNDDPTEDDQDDESFDIIQNYDLALVKNITSAGPYSPGDIIEFTLSVMNEGTLNAANVEVTDVPPSFLLFQGFESDSNLNYLGNGTWEILSLPTGATQDIVVSYQIDPLTQSLSGTNTAQITGDDGEDEDSTPGNDNPTEDDQDEEFFEIVQTYDLALTKIVSSDGPYFPGDYISFAITVTNQGTLDANAIEVTENSPAFLIYQGLDPNANVTELGNEVFLINSIPVNTQETFNVTYQIDPDFQGFEGTNFAEITKDNPEFEDIDSSPDSGPDVDEDGDGDGDDDDEDGEIFEVEQIYDLALDKNYTGTDPIGPGSFLTFDLVVTNEGTLDATDVQVSDLANADLIYVSSVAAPGLVELGGGVFMIQSLPHGTSKTIQVTYQLNPDFRGLSITNNALISGDDEEFDDVDSDPDSGPDNDDLSDGIPDDDEDEVTLTIDLGTIGDFVWKDENYNGIQDPGERGIANVVVKLFTCDGELVDQTQTDANGFYLFEDVYPIDYYIVFDTRYIDDACDFTLQDVGDDANDSDANSEGVTDCFSLNPGEDKNDIDAGFYTCIPIGELVWYDTNENDIWDDQENGINGITVELYRYEGGMWRVWDTQETGHKPDTPSDDGYFKFCAPPGRYYVKFIIPPYGLVQVQPKMGLDENRDSDITNTFGFGTTLDFNVDLGDKKCDIGAGYYPMATVGDHVWMDDNQNGLKDAGEQPMSGVQVDVYNSEGDHVSSTSTDQNGNYMIDYLRKEEYYLRITPPEGMSATIAHQGSDIMRDSDINHSNGPNTTAMLIMHPGVHVPAIDAGIIPTASTLASELLSFTAEHTDRGNLIEWITENEVQHDRYDIERRIGENATFETIGSVVAKNTAGRLDYLFLDSESLPSGSIYYRLKSIDENASFNYSDVRVVDVEASDEFAISVYPNPTSGKFNMDLKNTTGGELHVELYSSAGKMVKEFVSDVSIGSGDVSFEFDASDLVQGYHTLRVKVSDKVFIKRMVIQQ